MVERRPRGAVRTHAVGASLLGEDSELREECQQDVKEKDAAEGFGFRKRRWGTSPPSKLEPLPSPNFFYNKKKKKNNKRQEKQKTRTSEEGKEGEARVTTSLKLPSFVIL